MGRVRSESQRLAISEASSRRYYERTAVGICYTGCGRPAAPGLKVCWICRNNQGKSRRLSRDNDFIAACDKYGGRFCANPNCGENIVEFLIVDHVFGGGKSHGISHLPTWLRIENYPSGYQILCANDNLGKSINGNMLVTSSTLYVCDCNYDDGSSTNSSLKCQHGFTYTVRHLRRQRLIAYEAYGGSKCVCCGVTNPFYLTFDHEFDDGAEHRKITGVNLVPWLRKNNYPQDIGLRIMCQNCNSAREYNGGICPHRFGSYFGGLGSNICSSMF